jgi:hypothetical protein
LTIKLFPVYYHIRQIRSYDLIKDKQSSIALGLLKIKNKQITTNHLGDPGSKHV